MPYKSEAVLYSRKLDIFSGIFSLFGLMNMTIHKFTISKNFLISTKGYSYLTVNIMMPKIALRWIKEAKPIIDERKKVLIDQLF